MNLLKILLPVILGIACVACQMAPDAEQQRRDSEMDKRVRENMRTAQIAAEKYAADHGSINYPATIDDDYKSYFPGGIGGKRPAPVGPVNPFTGENEFPALAGVVKDVVSTRDGKRFSLQRGKVFYTPLNGGKSYAIVGGAHDDQAMTDENEPTQVLVFSNI
jgi:hypothetical protein